MHKPKLGYDDLDVDAMIIEKLQESLNEDTHIEYRKYWVNNIYGSIRLMTPFRASLVSYRD